MTLLHFVRVLRRRWLITLLGLAVTVGACFAVGTVVPRQFSVQATMVLIPPVDRSEPGANPYLALGGLTGPVEILARSMKDPHNQEQIKAAGFHGDYEVERDFLTTAPVFVITATDDTPASAIKGRDLIISRVPKALADLQASIAVPPSARITADVINSSNDVQDVWKPMIRAILFVLALGGLVTTGLAAMVDSLVVSRGVRARAGAKAAPGDANPLVTGGDEPTRGRVAAQR